MFNFRVSLTLSYLDDIMSKSIYNVKNFKNNFLEDSMKEIKIPKQMVQVKARMDEIKTLQEKNRKEALEFYETKKKGEEVDYTEINNEIAKMEKMNDDILYSFCKYGVHLYEKIVLNLNWEKVESSELGYTYIKVEKCILCGKVKSVKIIITEPCTHYTLGTLHYSSKFVGEERITEEVYKDKIVNISTTPISLIKEDILYKITRYLSFSAKMPELDELAMYTFECSQAVQKIFFSKYGGIEVISLMQQYVDNNNIIEKLRGDKEKLPMEIWRKNVESRNELCSLFGHDFPSGYDEGESFVCSCCNNTYHYSAAIEKWEKAPFKGVIFEKPTFREVRVEYVPFLPRGCNSDD